ncbi:MAG: SufD family Fe-S cluster assembly protein [Dehalococcoidia bacterium]|nr:SufD family Fe-S cluster assembly protein [Dehalococcoidia bacterium]
MSKVIRQRKSRELAEKALDKKPALGEDIDLSRYSSTAEEHAYREKPSELPPQDKAQLMKVGLMLDDASQRSGTFVQIDRSVVHSSASQEGVEVLPITEALEKHDWLQDYWWRAVSVDQDKFTAQAEIDLHNGYFIRALPGAKVLYPVQACLYIAHKNLAQKVHNIIIAEEGSELHIITGCATHPMNASGLHIGISEFYIKRGAKVTFTMIHNWAPEIEVRPRSGAILEEGAVFMSNYVSMKPMRSLQMYPVARCVGEGAVVRFNSILVAPPGSHLDTGSRVLLEAKGSRAEIVARTITTGGTIISRGHIAGSAPEVKGHLECRGLILSERGIIHAIPELRGEIAGIDLSHEAAVGKIAEEEVEYLMSRGMGRDEAVAMIVRGFLHVDIEGLPPELAAELQRAVEISEKDLF